MEASETYVPYREELKSMFYNFASFGARGGTVSDMDGRNFAKLCKDCNLIDSKFKSTDVDLIFAKVKNKGERKISFEAFIKALLHIADKKSILLEDVVKAVLETGGPIVNSIDATYNRFHDDKSTYTGVYARGGPSTMDQPRSLEFVLDRSPADVRGVKRIQENINTKMSALDIRSSILGEQTREQKRDAVTGGQPRGMAAMGGIARLPVPGLRSGSPDAAPSPGRPGIYAAFVEFATFGNPQAASAFKQIDMDTVHFTKMCKDAGLMDAHFNVTLADVVFTKAKPKTERKVTFTEFLKALEFIAEEKGWPTLQVYEAIIDAAPSSGRNAMPHPTGSDTLAPYANGLRVGTPPQQHPYLPGMQRMSSPPQPLTPVNGETGPVRSNSAPSSSFSGSAHGSLSPLVTAPSMPLPPTAVVPPPPAIPVLPTPPAMAAVAAAPQPSLLAYAHASGAPLAAPSQASLAAPPKPLLSVMPVYAPLAMSGAQGSAYPVPVFSGATKMMLNVPPPEDEDVAPAVPAIFDYSTLANPASPSRKEALAAQATQAQATDPAPAPYGSTAPAPYGSTAPAPYGSTVPAPYGTAPPPYGTAATPAQYGSTTAPAPYGSSTAPPPYGHAPSASTYGASTAPPPYGSNPTPSPFSTDPSPSPYSNPAPYRTAAALPPYGSAPTAPASASPAVAPPPAPLPPVAPPPAAPPPAVSPPIYGALALYASNPVPEAEPSFGSRVVPVAAPSHVRIQPSESLSTIRSTDSHAKPLPGSVSKSALRAGPSQIKPAAATAGSSKGGFSFKPGNAKSYSRAASVAHSTIPSLPSTRAQSIIDDDLDDGELILPMHAHDRVEPDGRWTEEVDPYAGWARQRN